MILLRHATAVTVFLGPLVDAADGFTPETAITFGANELDLYKAGSAVGVDISSRTVAHIAGGVYRLSLAVGDVDTLGPLVIVARDPAHRPWRMEALVVNANAYDSLAGGDRLWADVRELDGSGDAASNLRRGAETVKEVIVGIGATTTVVPTNLTESVNGHYSGRTLLFLNGMLALQATTITAYNGATKELTVQGLTSPPASGDRALIV